MRRVIRTVNTWVVRFFWLTFLSIAAFFFWFFSEMPSLKNVHEQMTFTVTENNKKREVTIKPSHTHFIKAQSLPNHVLGAILVSEDAAFYQHDGIDWHEVVESFKTNLQRGRYARGASTITQQVVKNAFLSSEKTLTRKVIEAITSLRLERTLSKNEILSYYLNLIELGPGVYGIRDGARYYFGVEPAALSPRQAALIAFLIPSPVKYGAALKKGQPSSFRESRVRTIMRNMRLQGYLNDGGTTAQDKQTAGTESDGEDSSLDTDFGEDAFQEEEGASEEDTAI